MPSKKARTLWIQEFKGLWDSISPGADPTTSPDCKNVRIAHKHIEPRGGISHDIGYDPNSQMPETPATGLWSYPGKNGTNYLVRMMPTQAESFNTGSGLWGDITGSTPLTGSGTDRCQATIIDDHIVITNEGKDLPKKWEYSTGSPLATIGNGSTPPYCKSIEAYLGFLMLGNISTDGTFTDLADGHRTIMYSDDWDNDWNGCSGNTIVLDETPGALLAQITLGKDLICFKDDGIVKVRWVGGVVRFQQEKYKFDFGILAPLSAVKVSDSMIIFLATDGVIYALTEASITPLSYDTTSLEFPRLLMVNRLQDARAMVHKTDNLYYLFYDSTNSLAGSPYSDTYIAYNYKEQAMTKGGTYWPITAVASHIFKPDTMVEKLFVCLQDGYTSTFDDVTVEDDVDLTRPEGLRYYITNWIDAGEEGECVGVRLILKKVLTNPVEVDDDEGSPG